MTTPARSPALQAAIDQLIAADDDLDVDTRVAFAERLASAKQKATDPRTEPVVESLRRLVVVGATPERIELVRSILAVLGPEVRAAVATWARNVGRTEKTGGDWWAAVGGLTDAVVE